MPIYRYLCPSGHSFEAMLFSAADALLYEDEHSCPYCTAIAQRELSPTKCIDLSTPGRKD